MSLNKGFALYVHLSSLCKYLQKHTNRIRKRINIYVIAELKIEKKKKSEMTDGEMENDVNKISQLVECV